MNWKGFTTDYLRFSKKDRIAGLLVIAVLAIIYFLPFIFSSASNSSALISNDVLKNAVDTLQTRKNKTEFNEEREASNYQFEPSERKDFTKGELFDFDPNTLPAEGWQRLGLSERTAKTILNYRSKGGKFYKPEDVKKIWGLPDGFYERVAAYIKLETPEKTEYKNYTSTPYVKTTRNLAIANLNTTDTTALIALPGIGSKLALRITAFRDKLGGFHSINQVAETFGLPDSTFQKIKPFLAVDAAGVKKININAATKEELKTHPYVRWNLANAIVEYRTQHGSYKNLEELKKIVLIDEATFSKMAPYLSL